MEAQVVTGRLRFGEHHMIPLGDMFELVHLHLRDAGGKLVAPGEHSFKFHLVRGDLDDLREYDKVCYRYHAAKRTDQSPLYTHLC